MKSDINIHVSVVKYSFNVYIFDLSDIFDQGKVSY